LNQSLAALYVKSKQGRLRTIPAKKVESPAYHLAALCLRVTLVFALIAVGWNIYRKLPGGEATGLNRANPSQTALVVALHASPEDMRAANELPLKLYPVDITAVRREYFMEHRAGVRFEDFLTQRMNGQSPVIAKLDEHAQASVTVAPGTWWIYATMRGAQNEEIEWRLRVNVAGQRQRVELTRENAYMRTKRF